MTKVALLMLLAVLLAACGADLGPIGDLDEAPESGATPSDAVSAETAETVDSSPASSDTLLGGEDGASAPDTATTPPDTARPDSARPDAAPACLHDGGVPLGYFCSRAEDCCSGKCGGPDKRCLSD